MRVDLLGLFRNVTDALRRGDKSMADYYGFCLDEVMRHLQETVAGEHTLQEFAEHYCVEKHPRLPEIADA